MVLLKPRLLSFTLLSALTTSGISATQAQDVSPDTDKPYLLPTVVISGSKRNETLNKINGAVSVANQFDLEDAQVNSTLNLDRVFPELYMSHSASFLYPVSTLRGVTSVEDLYNPALTVYVDGFPQLPTFAAQSLLGVEQIELLKGPQGTLYGKSAQGGVLNIVTQKPSNIPEFKVRTGFSSRNSYLLQAEASGPLVKDLLYGSVSLLADDVKGGLRSNVIGSKYLGGIRSQAGSAKLRLAPISSPWELGLSASRDCATANQDVYTFYDDYQSDQAYVLPNLPEGYRDFRQKRCANSFALHGQYDFDIWRLSTIVSTQHLNLNRHWPLNAYFPQFQENWKQNTQDLRLATRSESNDTGQRRQWDAVFGLYRQSVDLSRGYQFDMVMPNPQRVMQTSSSNQSQALAAYGDVTWHLTPEFDLTTGLRFTRDMAKTDFQGNQMGTAFQGNASAGQNTWLGHLAAGYQFSPNLRGYVNVSQGYKPMGYNLAPTNLADAKGYARERSTSYEVGMHYATQGLRTNLSVYRVDTQDVQLYGDADFGYQTLKNAGDIRSIGVEFDTEWDVTHQWTLSAGGFVNHATFEHFIDSKTCTNCQGNHVPMAPKYGLTLSAKGNLPVSGTILRPQLTLRVIGSHYFNSSNTLHQGTYALLDAALIWSPTPNLELMLYAKNLTNKKYRTYGFSYGATGNFAQVAPGRTVGLTATYRY